MGTKSLDEHIEEMHNLAETLVSHTYPLAPYTDSCIVNLLKQRVIYVDGFEVCVFLSREDHGDRYVERLEVMSAEFPFLPMYLACKIAVLYLGGHGLRHYDVIKNGRKTYVWSVDLDKKGRPLTHRANLSSYEGFSYEEIVN